MAALWNIPAVQVATWALVKVLIILHALLGVVSYLIYAERKICGHIQARTGPEPRRPAGLLQPPPTCSSSSSRRSSCPPARTR